VPRGEGDSTPGPELPDGIRRVATLGPHDGAVNRIAWSPDGSLIAVPSRTGPIVMWDVATATRVRELARDSGNAYAVAFDASGRTLASVGAKGDRDLQLWDVASGALMHTATGPGSLDVAFTRAGSLIAVAGLDGSARVWRVGDGVELVHDLGTTSDLLWCIGFDASGRLLAVGLDDGSIELWDIAHGELAGTLSGHPPGVLAVTFHPDGILASAGHDDTIRLWDPSARRLLRTLEGHTATVGAVAFLDGGRLLASADKRGSLRLWDPANGLLVTTVGGGPELKAAQWALGLVGDPSGPRLAWAPAGSRDIEILEFDTDALLGRSRPTSVTYTSAKIVLVGDSGVGKTGLGWRLAHGEFVEHASTHGQQFWLLDDLGTFRADGAECEAVLWDLAGQPDYRLIHALFLDDADLALVLFDPTRDEDPLHGVEYWLRQLGIGISGAEDAKNHSAILVAARADRGTPRLTADDVEGFCAQRGVRAFVTTSASTGEGLEQLLGRMRDAIDWDARPTTVTTATFKAIKDHVLGLKERADDERVILEPGELRARLERAGVAAGFEDDEMLAAVGHLANHGYVTRLRTSKGEERILLAPELLNNVAASIVLEARRNPKGLGSIEEERVLAGEYAFPELEDLSPADREALLDAAEARFLDHSLCFRQTDPLSSRVYLVFPELINLKQRSGGDEQPVEDGVAYTAVGSIENLYASLVVLLGYTSQFTRTSQWRGIARYVFGDDWVCGFRLEAEREGELDLVLYFGTSVGEPIRTLFQGLFESFLARRNLAVRRYEPVVCANGHRLNRATVREQVAEGSAMAFCSRCGERVALPSSDAPIELTAEQSADVRDQRRAAARRSRFEQAAFRLRAYAIQEAIAAPSCFVSYAWGDAAHERWVETLAEDLVKAGVAVVLDRWENTRIGASVARFVERVATCDRVIVVGTPGYRLKYDNRASADGSVAAAEGDLIGMRMLGTEAGKQAVHPVLREGTPAKSFPPLLRGRVHADFRDCEEYFGGCLRLALSIYAISPREPIVAELDRLLGRDARNADV